MPKVSVIIPVYNVEKYLRQCLDSVINQTLSDIEIICVDDGSTDSSLAILEEYANKDDRIKILKQQNQYAGVARNNGIKIASGEYIHFLDSDDWLDLDSYEKLYNLIKEKECDFIKFKSHTYDNISNKIIDAYYTNIGYFKEEDFNKYYDFLNNYEKLIKVSDAPWSGLYKTKFIKENNIYFDNLICANDVAFYYRCLTKANKIYISNQRHVYYRINNSSSLIGIRAYNFDCQLKLYKNIASIVSLFDETIRKKVLENLCNSIFYRYYMYLENEKLSDNAKFKIIKQLDDFKKELDYKPINKTYKKAYKYLKTNIFKYYLHSFNYLNISKLFGSIFSIKNQKDKKHKTITIFGVKLKFKRRRNA